MQKFKIRASAAKQIMTDPRTKKDKELGKLSQSCKQYVREWLIAEKYGRKKITNSIQMLKGTEMELDSMEALSELHGVKYFKNDDQLENELATGSPDIVTAEEIIDIKSSYDIFTFHNAESPFTAGRDYTAYGWQLQVYMWLTGKQFARLAYVLVDSPEWVVEDEVRKAYYSMKIQTDEEADYFSKEIEPLIRANHFFTKEYEGAPAIPLGDRIIEYEIDFDPEAINRLKNRVKMIREKLTNNYSEIWK